MTYSIFTFLLGLTIYHGFTWTRALDPSAGTYDSRNVFIALVVGAGFCQGFFTTASIAKVIETILLPSRLQSTASGTNRDEPLQRQGVDELVVGGLTAALQAAADAHLQCAEADRRVAFEYARLS